MQSEIYKKQDKNGNIWLEQNLTPRKASAIMSMIKQMTEPELGRKSGDLLKIINDNTEKSNERQCNIFWMDAC